MSSSSTLSRRVTRGGRNTISSNPHNHSPFSKIPEYDINFFFNDEAPQFPSPNPNSNIDTQKRYGNIEETSQAATGHNPEGLQSELAIFGLQFQKIVLVDEIVKQNAIIASVYMLIKNVDVMILCNAT